MNRRPVLLCALLLASGSVVSAADGADTFLDPRVRLGVDSTVPLPLVFVDLKFWEVLLGPTIHVPLTGSIDAKATLAPAVRISSLVTQWMQENDTDAFFALGVAEAGVRFYRSPYVRSWFIDADAAALFAFVRSQGDRLFEISAAVPSISIGYEFPTKRGFTASLEAGILLFIPYTGLEDGPDQFIPWPKVSATIYF